MNESPMMHQPHFKHLADNDTFLRPEDLPKFDEVIDWLLEKKRQGYKMVNSASRIQAILPAALLFNPEPYRGLLLQRYSRDPLALQTSCARISRPDEF
ncbi:MAG TPA: hypothetical protein VFA28_14085 [Bryobacteraceae bacterium]|nr:hypothetical protein [Bryobacteraceae bacterium]